MKARFVKDFLNEGYGQKDVVRMEDIRTKAAGDHDKEMALASTQARLITKPEKAKARAEAAEEVFGAGSDIANIFGDRAVELGGSYVSSEASSGTLAPLTSADPKAERKFKVKSHLASERVRKTGEPEKKSGGGFSRGGGAFGTMGVGRYADAPETSDEHIWSPASIASLGKINLGTGDSKYFNVVENSPDGLIEIWRNTDGRFRGVITSSSEPHAKLGNSRRFLNDQTWKELDHGDSWRLIDYAPLKEIRELVRLYGASIQGYTYK